jgi:type II secretory pathway component PulJ
MGTNSTGDILMTDEDKRPTIILTIGGSAFALLAALMLNVYKDAQIALDVVRQHGQELLEIRTEITGLRNDLLERTRERYTEKDAEKDMIYILDRLERIENQVP